MTSVEIIRMKCAIAILLLLGATGLSQEACGQTTQPAAVTTTKTPWSDVVEQFAATLSEGEKPADLLKLLSDHPSVKVFGHGATDDPAKFARVAVGAKVIGAHAYPYLPATLAADIASDFTRASDIPDTIKSKMIPDDASIPRANATARQWLQGVLGAAAGTNEANGDEPIGVIVLWRANVGSDRLPSIMKDSPGDVLFVVLRGKESSDATRIRQILHGDPLASAN
jgi:hypothetical protein